MSIHSFCECSYFADRELTAGCFSAVSVFLSSSCHTDIEQSCSHKELTGNPVTNHTWNLTNLQPLSQDFFLFWKCKPMQSLV